MVVLVILIAVTLGVALMAWGAREYSSLSERLYRADSATEEEYRIARRQMNELAGQDWRNIIE